MATFPKSMILDKLRASRDYERDYFERDYDYTTGAYGGRPNRRDSSEYGVRVLMHHAEMVEARYKQAGGDPAERELARASVELFQRMSRSHDGIVRDAEERRQENSHLTTVLRKLGAGPTTVCLVWTQEMEDWCKEQVTGQYTVARHGLDGYFVFESVDQAAIFKLHWA